MTTTRQTIIQVIDGLEQLLDQAREVAEDSQADEAFDPSIDVDEVFDTATDILNLLDHETKEAP